MVVIVRRIVSTLLMVGFVSFLCGACAPKVDEKPPLAAREGPRSGMGDVRIAAIHGTPEPPGSRAGGCLERTRADAKSSPGSDACYQRYDGVGVVTQDGARICLGTLIGSKTVLTAAHCVSDGRALGFGVGCWLDHALEHAPVRRAEKHPAFAVAKTMPSAEHDLSVLCLERPLHVTPIALAPASLVDSDINANKLIFMGYGPTPFVVEDPPMMRRKAEMKIRRPAESLAFFFDEPRVAVWPHDSGGPVLLNQTDGLHVLGVVSQGDDGDHCPKAASRVDKDRAWILDVKRDICGDES